MLNPAHETEVSILRNINSSKPLNAIYVNTIYVKAIEKLKYKEEKVETREKFGRGIDLEISKGDD